MLIMLEQTVKRILEAKVYDVAQETPLSPAPFLSARLGHEIWLKREDLQPIFSFKIRGAYNMMAHLDEEARRRGVITASAGNHAQGVALAAAKLGIKATIVMGNNTPDIKIRAVRARGANVVLHGVSFDDARVFAEARMKAEGLTWVPPYDHPLVIAGQGTAALEVLDDVPDADAIVVPTGGAGLLAGVAVAAKARRPNIRIISVEAAAAASFTASLAAGRPVEAPVRPTLADGLAVGKVGERAFALAAPQVDRVVTVDEQALSLAVLRLLELEKTVCEGAGAAALAAVMGPLGQELAGRKVVLLLCGGNIDPTILHRVIDHGLAADSRLWRFTAHVSDRPGGIARLTAAIADAGASVLEIKHDRAFSGPDVFSTTVEVTVEAADRDHVARLYQQLRDGGFQVIPSTGSR